MKIRKSNTRGLINKSWKNEDNYQSYRSFSCMSYQDSNYMGFGPVLTINDDTTLPGFITTWHEHKNLDIINYMIEGECTHVDNLGNNNTAVVNQIQHFWCGDSIWHSLSNRSDKHNRYLQIWIAPDSIVQDRKTQYQFLNRELDFSPLPVKFKNSRIQVWGGELNQNLLIDKLSYLLVLQGQCMVDSNVLENGDAVEFSKPELVQPIGHCHIILFELE